MSAVQWGTVPDWIAAISTALAFLGALIFLLITMKDRRLTARDRLEVEELRLAEQARLVSAWVKGLTATTTFDSVYIVVRNRSEEPIYNLHVTLFGADGKPLGFDMPVVPPDTRGEETIDCHGPSQRPSGDRYALTITFRDARGVIWRRSPEGRLNRLAAYPDNT